MYRYLVTKREKIGQESIVSALYDEKKRMLDVLVDPIVTVDEEGIGKNVTKIALGNIYVAKVQNIVKNLDAAFVKISQEQTCYLSLKELKNPIYVTKRSEKKNLVEGDEIVVQITKEALKTKEPVVSTNLNFSGKYAVVTSGNRKIGISAKLSADKRAHFKELLEQQNDRNYGIIVRTNAKDVSDEEVLKEIELLKQRYVTLVQTAIHRTCYSCLSKEPASYLKNLSNLYLNKVEKIITDEKDLYEEMAAFLKDTQNPIPLEFYEDEQLSLSSLYSVNATLTDALKERVWLKSGAYLIIQPTEALTVVDVNSGKNIAKKDVQENFRKINLEAAEAIAYQLRLRNISGIVIVDFINMDSKEANEQLVKDFRAMLKKDPIPTDVWDITKLGLIEVTRKKVRKSLKEALANEINNGCKKG